MTRPTWDETWMSVAEAVGLRSKCDRRRIGACIVSEDNGYVVVGYNGPPASFDAPDGSTCQDWCPRMLNPSPGPSYEDCVTVHAETNAIAKADRTRIQDGTLYVTSAVCWDCAKVVANSGVARVMMWLEQDDMHRNPQRSINFLKQCGIEVRVILR